MVSNRGRSLSLSSSGHFSFEPGPRKQVGEKGESLHLLRIDYVPGTDLMCIYSCNPYSNPMGTVIIIPIIQMSKLRLRWLKEIAQGHS